MKTLEEQFPTLTKEEISRCKETALHVVGMMYDGKIPDGARENAIISNCKEAAKKKEEG